MNASSTTIEKPTAFNGVESREHMVGINHAPAVPLDGMGCIAVQMVLTELVRQTLIGADVPFDKLGSAPIPPEILLIFYTSAKARALDELAAPIMSRWSNLGAWELAWFDPAEGIWRPRIARPGLEFGRLLSAAGEQKIHAFRRFMGLPPLPNPNPES